MGRKMCRNRSTRVLHMEKQYVMTSLPPILETDEEQAPKCVYIVYVMITCMGMCWYPCDLLVLIWCITSVLLGVAYACIMGAAAIQLALSHPFDLDTHTDAVPMFLHVGHSNAVHLKAIIQQLKKMTC